ncbi:MAG: hypothetical protein ACI9OI_000200 [Chitinophagales bacterium]|jgi:hypothetical protein
MSIYVLPAFTALLVSIVVFLAAIQGANRSNVFGTMVFLFICLSVCEVLSFFDFFKAGRLAYLMRAYYSIALLGLCSVFAYILSVVRGNSNKALWGTYFGALCLSGLILFTDIIIVGIEPLGHSRTAIKGGMYFIFQGFALTMMVLIIGSLVRGYLKPEDHLMQIQCSYSLLAILPLLICNLGLLLAMAIGYKLNAAIVMPAVMVAFLLITLVGESRHHITDVRRFMPYSAERHTSNEIMEIFSSFSRDEVSYRDGVSQIERLLVLHKYKKNDSNASATAQLMKMPRSSLYSIFNRLGIDPENNEKD